MLEEAIGKEKIKRTLAINSFIIAVQASLMIHTADN
jgi:hypothetical protein